MRRDLGDRPSEDPPGAGETRAPEARESEPRRGPGEAGRDAPRVAIQFSVYPLRQDHLSPGVEAAVSAAAESGVQVRVQNLSTLIQGSEEDAFAALRAAFRAARGVGDTVMVATLSTGLPSDERVAEIQADAGRTGER